MRFRLLSLFLLLFLLLLSACSTEPHIVISTDIAVTSDKEIYIVSHGWHTGFIVPADTITQQLPQLKERFQNTPYIEFGWGDRGFYQAEEITSGLTVQAILWPTESVMHVVTVSEPAQNHFPNSQLETLCLNGKQYSRLISFIENSFFKDSTGNILPLKKGIYGDSQFYKARGNYYLMNTCNKWTAKGLNSAGMDIFTDFKFTADSIMDYLTEQKKALSNSASGCSTNTSLH